MAAVDLWERVIAPDNLVAAWAKVRRAGGCAGVDGQSLEEFGAHEQAHLDDLWRDLTEGSYRPLPLKRLYLPKRHGGLRPLGVPTVRDRVAQAAVVLQLQPVLEPQFAECSYAYRPARSWLDAVNRVSHWRGRGREIVVRADIDRFFDTLDHGLLLDLLRPVLDTPSAATILDLISRWLTSPICEGGDLLPATMGVPQGAVISPLLSNLYLNPFDQALTAGGCRLVRYADDFVVVCHDQTEAETALRLVEEQLARLKLRPEPTKTGIVSFADGFEFLGTRFRGRDRWLPEGWRGYWRDGDVAPPQPLPAARLSHLWRDELLPLSLLEKFAVCPRAVALRCFCGDEAPTAGMQAGRQAEEAQHRRLSRDPDATVSLEVPVMAPQLGLQGRLDAIQDKWGLRLPIEYRWSWTGKVHPALTLKVTAAAMALEEAGGRAVPLGYVEFLPGNRREIVEVTEQRRAEVREAVAGLRALLDSGLLPDPTPGERCGGCSMRPACLPEETRLYRQALEEMIGGAAEGSDSAAGG